MNNTPPLGNAEAFGLEFETTFGTANAPSVWWRPVSNTLKRVDPTLPLSGPTGGQFDVTTTRAFRGKPDISGTVVVEADYDYMGYLLQNTVANGGTATLIEDSAFSHGFVLPFATPTTPPTSFTCARVTDQTSWDMQFTGCMINALEISGAENRLVTCSMDIVAQGGGEADVTDAIGTLSTAPFIEFHDSYLRADFSATGTSLNATHNQDDGAEAIDWTLRIDNNYRRQQAAGNGVRGDREYTWTGNRVVTLTVNRDFFDTNFYDEYHNATLANRFGTFGVTCISDEEAAPTTPTYYTFSFSITAGYVDNMTQEYPGGPDILPENVVIKAGYNGTNSPLTMSLKNQNANDYTGVVGP